MFAVIYTGCRCGETWRVRRQEIIECERDSVETILVCAVCGGNVLSEKKIGECVEVHVLTDEELEADFWEGEGWDDDDF